MTQQLKQGKPQQAPAQQAAPQQAPPQKAAQQQAPAQQNQQQNQQYQQLLDHLHELQVELSQIKEDIIEARNNKERLGPYLTEKQDITQQIETVKTRLKSLEPPAAPEKPVFDNNQIIVSTSSVRRKDAVTLRDKDKLNNKQP